MTSLKRVRRDHTCIFLDFSYEDMCEKCIEKMVLVGSYKKIWFQIVQKFGSQM